MIRVWKYELDLNSVKDSVHTVTFDTKVGAEPLCVMNQNGRPCVWVKVDDRAEDDKLVLFCVGTGYGAVPPGAGYFASVIDGPYVWHLFFPPPKEKRKV